MSLNSPTHKIEVRYYQENLPREFASLIPPEIASFLQALPASCLALGVVLEGTPLGLAIADLRPSAGTARLLALNVDESVRRRSIGSQLYRLLESMLKQQGIRCINAEFLAGTEPDSVLSRFLGTCGYHEPVPGTHIWSGPLQMVQHSPWLERLQLSPPFTLHSFESLSREERLMIRQGNGKWYPSILDPFAEEEHIDHECSLIVRHLHKIIGWMILEHFDDQTVLFKTMFVKKEYQRMGRGIALVAEAYRRVLHDGKYTNGIFFAEADNKSMIQFMHRRMNHPGIRKEILWRTSSTLTS